MMSSRLGRRTCHLGPVASGLVLAAVMTAGCTTSGPSATGDKGYISGDGVVTTVAVADRQDTPKLAGTGLSGAPIDVADYRGQVVVVNVWASWCGPCISEADDLVQAADALPRAKFVGINTREDDESAATAFVRDKNVPYDSIVDDDGSVLLSFYGMLNLASLPVTIVLDQQGRIASTVRGPVDATTLEGLVRDVQKEVRGR